MLSSTTDHFRFGKSVISSNFCPSELVNITLRNNLIPISLTPFNWSLCKIILANKDLLLYKITKDKILVATLKLNHVFPTKLKNKS